MLLVSTLQMKMEFSSQRIEMCLFLTTNMAALTLRYVEIVKWCEKQRRVRWYRNGRGEVEFHFANYANLISLMSQRQKINLYKIPSRSYISELISGLFCLDIEKNIYYYL